MNPEPKHFETRNLPGDAPGDPRRTGLAVGLALGFSACVAVHAILGRATWHRFTPWASAQGVVGVPTVGGRPTGHRNLAETVP